MTKQSLSHRLLFSASLVAAAAALTGCGDKNTSTTAKPTATQQPQEQKPAQQPAPPKGSAQAITLKESELEAILKQLENPRNLTQDEVEALNKEKIAKVEEVNAARDEHWKKMLKEVREKAEKEVAKERAAAEAAGKPSDAEKANMTVLNDVTEKFQKLDEILTDKRKEISEAPFFADISGRYDEYTYHQALKAQADLITALKDQAVKPDDHFQEVSAGLKPLKEQVDTLDDNLAALTPSQNQMLRLVQLLESRLNDAENVRKRYNETVLRFQDMKAGVDARTKALKDQVIKDINDEAVVLDGATIRNADVFRNQLTESFRKEGVLETRSGAAITDGEAEGFNRLRAGLRKYVDNSGSIDIDKLRKTGERDKIATEMVKALYETGLGQANAGSTDAMGNASRAEGILRPAPIQADTSAGTIKVADTLAGLAAAPVQPLALYADIERPKLKKTQEEVAKVKTIRGKATFVPKGGGAAGGTYTLQLAGKYATVGGAPTVDKDNHDTTHEIYFLNNAGARQKLTNQAALKTAADAYGVPAANPANAAEGVLMDNLQLEIATAVAEIAEKSAAGAANGEATGAIARVALVPQGGAAVGLTNIQEARDAGQAIRTAAKVAAGAAVAPNISQLDALKAAIQVGRWSVAMNDERIKGGAVAAVLAKLPQIAKNAGDTAPEAWAGHFVVDAAGALAGAAPAVDPMPAWARATINAVVETVVAAGQRTFILPDVMMAPNGTTNFVSEEMFRWAELWDKAPGTAGAQLTEYGKEVKDAIDAVLKNYSALKDFWDTLAADGTPLTLALDAGFMRQTPDALGNHSLRGQRTGLRTGFDASQFTLNGVQGETIQLKGPVSVQLNGSISDGKATAGTSMTATYRMGNTLFGAIQSYANDGKGFEGAASQSETAVVASHNFGPYFVEARLGSVVADNVHDSNWSGTHSQLTVGLDTQFVSPFLQMSHRNLNRDATYTLDHSNVALGLDMDLGALQADSYIFESRLTAKVGYGEKHWSKGSRSNGLHGANASVEWSANLSLNSGVGFSTNLALDSTTGSSAGFNVSLDR